MYKNNKTKSSKTINTKKRKMLIIAGISTIVILLITCIILLVVLLTNSSNVPVNANVNATSEEPRDYLVTPDNVDDIISTLDSTEIIPNGSYEVKMNAEWGFANSSTPSYNAFVANVVNNTQDVYFDVIENNTGETIYKSPIIPIGSSLENIALNTALSPGTYECTLIYYLLDDNGDSSSTLQIAIKVIIENESKD